MPYQALARKWRPRNFSEVVGQEHVVKALTHALEFDRMHHAYLFTGTRGVGKTTLGRILAKALNCAHRTGFNPCGECLICREVDEGRFVDLLEVDAASRTKVEDTRDLLENVQYAPIQGRFKIYLIDEVHMLSGHSFNALLKTLEEPPAHVKFLLATTDPQKIPVTVLSRCLQFNLKRLTPEQIRGQMESILREERIIFELNALRSLARAADGSMRDGLSLLDQAIVHGAGSVLDQSVSLMLGTVSGLPVFALLNSIASGDAGMMLRQICELAEHSPDFADALQQLLIVLHHVALAQWSPEAMRHDDDAEEIAALAQIMSKEDVQLLYQIGLIGQRDLPLAPDPQSGFEMTLLRMMAFRPTRFDRIARLAPDSNTTPAEARSDRHTQKADDTQTQVHESSQVTPPKPRQQSAADAHDWAALIQSMKLSGLTLQLANNCTLQSVDEVSVCLSLDSQLVQIRTPQLESKLEQALRSHFGKPLKLQIVTTAMNHDTPANQLKRDREDRQKAAELEIEQDQNIKSLKDEFDAKIIPGTIKPID